MRLNGIQQDPLLTPTISLTGIKPKQLIGPDYKDYPEYDHYRKQMIHEHAIYPEQNNLIDKQIKKRCLIIKKTLGRRKRPGYQTNSTSRI